MNELMAINKVATDFGISSRTLRYWESAGLFTSKRDAQSGWRVYDDSAIQCIRTTNLLRRLDFSLAEIKKYMEQQTIESLLNVLRKQLKKLDKASAEMDTRKEAISELITMLEAEASADLLSLESILLPAALERQRNIIMKLYGGFKMENIKTLRDEVKIRKMAPTRMVAYKCVSKSPENDSMKVVREWIAENKLEGTARIFGFNAEPYHPDAEGMYGFGFCATIPEGVEISEPLYEIRLQGGLYGVISDYEGDPMGGWRKAMELWKDPEWGWEYDNNRHGFPGLEEAINRVDDNGNPVPFPMPIWFPVKMKGV